MTDSASKVKPLYSAAIKTYYKHAFLAQWREALCC